MTTTPARHEHGRSLDTPGNAPTAPTAHHQAHKSPAVMYAPGCAIGKLNEAAEWLTTLRRHEGLALVDRDSAIYTAHETGHTDREIADACGLDRSRVTVIINRKGRVRDGRGRKS